MHEMVLISFQGVPCLLWETEIEIQHLAKNEPSHSGET